MASFSDILFGTSGSAVSDAQKKQQGINEQYQGAITSAIDPYKQLTNAQQTQELQQGLVGGLTGLNTDQYKTQAAQLQSGDVLNDVSGYLDPSIEYQQQQAQKGVESSAAGRGGLFSGAVGQEIADKTRSIAEQGWGQAYDRANAAQQTANQTALQQQQAQQSAGQYNLGMDTSKLGAQEQAYNAMLEPMGAYSQALMDTAGTMYGSQTGINQQALQAQAADKGYFSDILGTGAKLLGA